MISSSHMNMSRNERGTTIIFVAAVLLPVIFFLLSLALDTARYFTIRRNIQITLDQAAIYAHRFLPYTTAATTATTEYLSTLKGLASDTQIKIDSDTVTLEYSGTLPLSLASYFDYSLTLPVKAYSRTQTTPRDVFLLMDTAAYLSPQLPDGEPWSEARAAELFEHRLPIFHDHDKNGIPEEIDPKLVTEQCFNPTFSALKRSAIRTLEYLSSFRHNSVGLGFFPADNTFLDVVQPIGSAPLHGTPSILQFPRYRGGFVPSSYCAAAAEYEVSNRNFRFPSGSEQMTGLWTAPDGKPISMVEPANGYTFHLAYQPFLSPQELIWTQTTRTNRENLPDTVQLLRQIRSLLLTAPARIERGGLRDKAAKSAMIFAGDLPWSEGNRFVHPDGSLHSSVHAALSSEFLSLRKDVFQYGLHLTLYYIVFQHRNNTNNFPTAARKLESLFKQFASKDGEQSGSLSLHLLYGTDPEILTHDLTALLALDRKGAVLAR